MGGEIADVCVQEREVAKKSAHPNFYIPVDGEGEIFNTRRGDVVEDNAGKYVDPANLPNLSLGIV